MLKSPDHYSTAEVVQSPEEKIEDLKTQYNPTKNEKAIKDFRDRLQILKNSLMIKR